MELNKIYNEDCLEGMKRIPDKSVDLIITDPPYLMDYQSGRRKNKFDKIIGDKDSHQLISDCVDEYYRVLKDDSAIYMFCSWHHVDFFKKEFEKYFNLKNILVWNKNNHGSGDLKGSYAPKYEFVLFGHRGRALHKTKRVPDVLNYSKVSGSVSLHPTQKPIDLLEHFILNNSEENGIILDTFMGSGTTAIACINTNRNFIGFEMDKKYYDIANNRIAETLQKQ